MYGTLCLALINYLKLLRTFVKTDLGIYQNLSIQNHIRSMLPIEQEVKKQIETHSIPYLRNFKYDISLMQEIHQLILADSEKLVSTLEVKYRIQQALENFEQSYGEHKTAKHLREYGILFSYNEFLEQVNQNSIEAKDGKGIFYLKIPKTNRTHKKQCLQKTIDLYCCVHVDIDLPNGGFGPRELSFDFMNPNLKPDLNPKSLMILWINYK